MLNPGSPLPLYQQLAELLARDITSGGLGPGARLPSEPELSRRHRIGRPTVRQATELLVRRGLIERRRGSGTFVRTAPQRVDLFSLGGTLSSFHAGGVELSTKLLGKISKRRVPADAENPFAKRLAFTLVRLGSVANKPMLLERLYFDPDTFVDLDRVAHGNPSLSRLVEERYYLKPTHAEQSFRAELPRAEVRAALELGPSEPVLQVKRTLFFPRAPRAVFGELFCRTGELLFTQTIGAEASYD